ncbi:MAG: DUF2237 domain-containing protein [Desulfosarcinaceae bacterium]|nr:DUF2237 domain-containing protein [Desulfosarcinaceae bacterium]
MEATEDLNVLGGPLATCSLSPLTGFHRDGECRMGPADAGRHGVCAEVTEAFLEFTRQQGNDLSTPQPLVGFPGLQPGDRWCLCIDRWREAAAAGKAPPVVLAATHVDVLETIPLPLLEVSTAAD